MQEKTGRGVRILTLNMFLRPFFITTNGDDYRTQRLTAFVDTYCDRFDIICFQECFDWLSPWAGKMISLCQ